VSRLEGKAALITGAASGMGAVEARLFAEHGATVVLADVQDEKLSVAQARDQYGVVIDTAAAAVNMTETEALRATRLQPFVAAG